MLLCVLRGSFTTGSKCSMNEISIHFRALSWLEVQGSIARGENQQLSMLYLWRDPSPHRDQPTPGTSPETNSSGTGFRGFPFYLSVFLCILSYFNMNGFMWGLNPHPPECTHDPRILVLANLIRHICFVAS